MKDIDLPQTKYANRAIPVLTAIARKKLALTIDTETTQRWEDVMTMMRLVDTRADTPDPSSRLVGLLAILETFDEQYPRLSADNLGSKQYSQLIKNAAAIVRLGETLREATTVKAYMPIRQAEAVRTADTITMLATEPVQTQPGYDERFVPLVRQLAIAAGYIDTAQDAQRDFRDGTLGFVPTRRTRMTLLSSGIRELADALPQVISPSTPFDFARLGVKALWSHHLRNKAERRTND